MLAACSSTAGRPLAELPAKPSAYTATALNPPVALPALILPDTHGKAFDLQHRPRGEVTVVFFGYTHCPDLCPTTMADLAAAKRLLAPQVRARVRVVFVTEDPARDTAPVLRAWLDQFDPDFVGLLGGGGRTAAALRALHLPETVLPSTASAEQGSGHVPEVEHSGIVYAFSDGPTLLYTGGATPAQYANDLSMLASA